MKGTKTKEVRRRPPRDGEERKETKYSRLEAMLRHPQGTTVEELGSRLGWQPHTVRAAVSVLRKDKKLMISLTKGPNGDRVYRVEN
jgi:hypothetical protein